MMGGTFEKIRGHTLYIQGLPQRPVVLDLGANHGEFSRILRERYPGSYYLVEANRDLADKLSDDDRFTVWHKAVSSAVGTVGFNVAMNDEASSILPLPADSVYDAILVDRIEVASVTLESLCEAIPASRIDLLKVDIEGAEVMAFLAAPSKTLRPIGQITVEFHCHKSFGFGIKSQVESVIKRLRRLGFIDIDFSNGNRTNVLFVNRRVNGITHFKSLLWKIRQNPPRPLLGLWALAPRRAKQWARTLLARIGGSI